MNRRPLSYHIEDSLLFKIFSLVFFVGLLAYAGYQLKVKRDDGLRAARVAVETVRARLQEALQAAPPDGRRFETVARAELDRVEALRVLVLSSPGRGVVYVLARNRSYLIDPPESSRAVRGQLDLRFNPLLDARITLPFGPPASRLQLDALMRVLGRDAVFPILKDVMIILFAFVLAVVLFILITLSVSRPRAAGSLPPEFDGDLGEPGEPFARHPPAAATPPPQPSPRTPAGSSPPPAPAPGFEPESAGSERTLFSARTGLVWGEYMEERLRFELERAASFDQDLVLALISPDPLRRRPPSVRPAAAERIHRGLAQRVLGRYPLRDLVFEWKDYTIGLIVPDKSLDQAVTDLDAFRKSVKDAAWEDGPVTVSIGLSSRNGRLIDQGVLLREALAALARASREGGNSLIAFRADPDKFRRVVTSR